MAIIADLRTVHLRFMHVNAPVTTTSYRIQFATRKRSEDLMSAAVSRSGTTRNCLQKCNQRLWSSQCKAQNNLCSASWQWWLVVRWPRLTNETWKG